MNFDEFKQELLLDPDFREEYYKKDLAFEVSQLISNARVFKALSQAELAALAGTKQPSIARVENGHLPTLNFLEKLAKAMGTYLIPPKFGFMKDVRLEVYDGHETLDTKHVYSTSTNQVFSQKIYLLDFNSNMIGCTVNAK